MAFKYKLLISNTAKKDIDKTINYIANILKNKQAATKLYNSINDKINNICENPMISKDCSHYGINDETIRRVKIKNYILFFKIQKKEVVIIRFLYSKMNIESLLEKQYS